MINKPISIYILLHQAIIALEVQDYQEATSYVIQAYEQAHQQRLTRIRAASGKASQRKRWASQQNWLKARQSIELKQLVSELAIVDTITTPP
jgi:hypothetical protein